MLLLVFRIFPLSPVVEGRSLDIPNGFRVAAARTDDVLAVGFKVFLIFGSKAGCFRLEDVELRAQ